MKKLIMFFAGLMLMTLTFGVMVISGMIYDTGAKTTVETFFFQPNDYSSRRPGVPATAQDLSESKLRDMLVGKYLIEYFGVTPDMDEMTLRKAGKTALARMSVRRVFEHWAQNIAPEMETLAQAGVLRTASLVEIIPEPGSAEYWRVEYEIKTWNRPNDLSAKPVVERGKLYMNIVFEPKMREQIQNKSIEGYLESGGDPAAVFRFGILDLTTQE